MTKLIIKALLFVTLFTVFLSPFSLVQKQDGEINTIALQTNISYAQEEVDIDDSGFLDCSRFDFACKGINFLQIIFVTGGNIIVGLSAFFMDTFLFHSIQSSSYQDSGFIIQGWEILRNLTNIVFIFALLSMAFRMVLDVGQANAKKQLIRIILITLTINFSLFLSFAVIDMSNILAFTFYNKIDQQEVTFDASSSAVSQDGNEISTGDTEVEFKGKSTSLAIAKKINPQRLLNADAVSDGSVTKGQRVVMVLMAGVINGTLIYVFLSVAFLFLGRTIALWLTVVLSPLAFASLTIPGWEKKKYFGWDNWFSSLLQTSLMAPVFLFFLYLAVQFMKIDITFAGSGSGSFINNILNIVIPMAAIVVLLITAKKVANAMSGDFAGTISGIVAKGAMAVGGAALAVGTGGAALAGRSVIGKAASTAMKSDKFKNFTAKNPRMGRFAYKKFDKMQNASFDIGKTRAGKFAGKTAGSAGMQMKQPSWAKVGGEGKGGYKKYRKDEDKKAREFNTFLKGDVGKDKKDKKDKEKEVKNKETQINNNNSEREKIEKEYREKLKDMPSDSYGSTKKADLEKERDTKLKEHDDTKGKENVKLNTEIGSLEKVISDLENKINRKEGRSKEFIQNVDTGRFGNEESKGGKVYKTGIDAGAVVGIIAGIATGPLGGVIAGGITAGVSAVVRRVKSKNMARNLEDVKPEKEPSMKDIMEELKKKSKKEE